MNLNKKKINKRLVQQRYIKKDKKKRLLFTKFEEKKKILKFLLFKDENSRVDITNIYSILPKNSSKVKLKNRCILTDRGKSVSRLFKLSRIQAKKYIREGFFYGYFKSSW